MCHRAAGPVSGSGVDAAGGHLVQQVQRFLCTRLPLTHIRPTMVLTALGSSSRRPMAPDIPVTLLGQPRRSSYWRRRPAREIVASEISGRAHGADVFPYFTKVEKS